MAEALRNGGSDNITVVVLHYGAFVPLAANPAAPHAERLAEGVNARLDEDEDVTDPNQAWKRSLTAGSARSASSSHSSGSTNGSSLPNTDRRSTRSPEVNEEADRYARASFEDAPATIRRGVSPVLAGLLALAALAEAVALYLFWNGQIKPRHAVSVNAPTPTVETKPTDRPLTYKNPVVIYGKPNLWEGVLQVMPDDKVLVVDNKNQEWAITSGGTATPLPPTDIRVPALLKPTLRQDNTLKPVPSYPAIAMDASGYRYELNIRTKAIDKYYPSGTPLLTDIGKGLLKTPANLAVDKRGNLYTIDGNRLKIIQAVPDTGQPAPAPHTDMETSPNTPPAAAEQGAADGAAGKASGGTQ